MPTVFLSPSTQEYNHYVSGETEEEVMNRVADAMLPYLRSSGIQVARNSPGGNVLQSIEQSNSGNYDLHIALHSNASPENIAGQLQGPDIYYRQGNWRSRRFADILAQNFKTIYPYPWMVDTRASTQLAEVLRTIAPAVLIEIAYHDNPEDSRWILDNIDLIAKTIVRSATEYFGIPFVEAQPERPGRIATGGSNLLLRSRPNTGAPVLARMPDGSPVMVLGILPNGWYVTRYGGNVGYASGNYIELV